MHKSPKTSPHFYLPCQYKEMHKQKHTMDGQLNALLPALHISVISLVQNGSCTRGFWYMIRSKPEKLQSEMHSHAMKARQTKTSTIQRPFEERLWRVSVHPWHVLLLIWCASALCVAWKGSSFLSLAVSFLSLFFFPSPLHLHNSWRGFGQRAWKIYSLELIFFLKLKNVCHKGSCVSEGRKSQATLQEPKCVGGWLSLRVWDSQNGGVQHCPEGRWWSSGE